MKYIIDTNVPAKAANLTVNSELDKKCALSCLKFIRTIMNESDRPIIVLDANMEILREYRMNLSSS